MAAYRTPTACVLTTSGVAYDTGRTHPLSGRLDLRDIGAVLDGAERAFRGEGGVVLIGIDLNDAKAGLAKQPLGDRWQQAGGPDVAPWMTFINQRGCRINLGLLTELQANPKMLGPLLGGSQNATDLAWRLGRYQTLVGVPWTLTAGVSGCVGIRSRYTDRAAGAQPLWHHPRTLRGLRGTGPLVWTRPDVPPAGAPGTVHVLDINAMYLAGLRNANLAWGPLIERDGNTPFDPAWPGFWEIGTADIPEHLYDGRTQAPLFSRTLAHKGSVILSTEVVKYLTGRHGLTIDVLRSWTSDNGHPIARHFAERLMAARSGSLGPMGPCALAIKRTYAELVGMMAAPGGSIHRPDWAATVMDLSRVNLLRRLGRLDDCGTLLGVRTDAVYVHSTDDPAAVRVRLAELLGVGTGPGTFKYVEQLTVDAFRDKFGLAA